MSDDRIRTDLASLAARSKAGRFRQLLPEIEAKIREGVRLADILDALNANGFEMSMYVFKTYLDRSRKAAKNAQPQQRTAPAANTSTSPPAAEKRPGEPVKFSWADLKKQEPKW